MNPLMIAAAGGGQPHGKHQPYLVVNFLHRPRRHLPKPQLTRDVDNFRRHVASATADDQEGSQKQQRDDTKARCGRRYDEAEDEAAGGRGRSRTVRENALRTCRRARRRLRRIGRVGTVGVEIGVALGEEHVDRNRRERRRHKAEQHCPAGSCATIQYAIARTP